MTTPPPAVVFEAFTTAVAAYSMGRELSALPNPPENTARHLRRVLAAREQAGADTVVLYGLGSGALAAALSGALPPGTNLVVVDLSPELARALAREGKTGWRHPERGTSLLCDTSPWALVLLLTLHGLAGKRACHVANPDPGCLHVDRLREVQRIVTSSPVRTMRALPDGSAQPSNAVPAVDPSNAAPCAGQAPDMPRPCAAPSTPALNAAAILHPEEPGLDDFFAQFPAWLHELVVVWDADQPPQNTPPCAAPVRHLAHPLDSGFADQRNRMLAACNGDWVLYLDGDERLQPSTWSELPGLIATAAPAGFYFPRTTFDPDQHACRVGFGLWPDLQLRLFRRAGSLRFVNPIHEKLEGLDGPVGILLNRAIGHESVLRKSATAIREKLSRFDHASGNTVRHRLNEAYPTLACALLQPPQEAEAPARWLQLPSNPA